MYDVMIMVVLKTFVMFSLYTCAIDIVARTGRFPVQI